MIDDVYAYWRASHKGVPGPDLLLPTMYPSLEGQPVSAENPQCGLWKIQVGGGYKNGVKQDKVYQPMQIWLKDSQGKVVSKWSDGLAIGGLIDGIPANEDQLAARWIGAVLLKKADRDFYVKNGCWPEDPPPAVALTVKAIMSEPEPKASDLPPPAKGSVPGDNEGDQTSFLIMRAKIKGEIAEAQSFFTKHPIQTKADADKCENWRKRIHELGKEADERRDEEKRPFMEKANEIQALWKPLVDEAKAGALSLQATADAWVKAEQDRRQKIAQDEAQKRLDAEREHQVKVRREAEEKRKAVEAERAEMMKSDPIAAITGSLPDLPELPPEPAPVAAVVVVETPKIMLGTTGNRRSAKEAPATAVITDLKAAAAFYAGQSHPEMIKLIQKLADAAAKSRSEVPGITMSWQTKTETAA